MGRQEGTVSITGLPSHRGLILSVCFFRVDAADTPAPYAGDPPAEAVTDCHEVFKQVDLHTELLQTSYELPFRVERPAGYYYLQVRAILFRIEGGKVFAQAEQFFYSRRPLRITEGPSASITLPVSWPALPVEALHTYGVVKPQGQNPAEPTDPPSGV
jgi:hypothetical protein